MMESKHIIEDTFTEVYQNLNIHADEAKIIKDFIIHVDKLNINTFFIESSVMELMDYIVEKSERQEAILDFVNSMNIRLTVNGLDCKDIFSKIKESYTSFINSEELPENLKKQLTLESKEKDTMIVNISFLVRLYGINLIEELK